MKQYIDKAAIVTEIKRRRRVWRYGSSIEAKYKREECDDFLSFLDILEVKDGMDTIHPIDDVVSNGPISNPLEISRHGNSHIGETLEEAAKNHKSAIHIVSPQWTSEVEKAFKDGAKWQEEQYKKNIKEE